jgi:diphthamide biosynthesis enzyme Dph1/Dph2-like protein
VSVCLSFCLFVCLSVFVHHCDSCRTSRIPVVYVFGHAPIDVVQCQQYLTYVLSSNSARSHIVLYDVTYTHAIGE